MLYICNYSIWERNVNDYKFKVIFYNNCKFMFELNVLIRQFFG